MPISHKLKAVGFCKGTRSAVSVGQRTFSGDERPWKLQRRSRCAHACTHTVRAAPRALRAMPRTWTLPRAEDVSLSY